MTQLNLNGGTISSLFNSTNGTALAALTAANLSVAVTDDFMRAYKGNEDFPLINPRTGREVRRVRAHDLLRLIAQVAWASGDPGVIFIDTINRANPTPHIGEIEATNPCGEQPLLPYESCCLGSINLSKLVTNGDINWERLRELTHLGVRLAAALAGRRRHGRRTAASSTQ